jgi:shikimate 5-dehydrogenase
MPLRVQITLLSRHPARTTTQFVPTLASLCRDYGDAQIEADAARSVLIVQATSLGMAPYHDTAPPLCWQAVGPDQSVVDLIYNPWTTPFLQQALARRASTLNGWPMLVHQAALALEIWAGPGSGRHLIAAAELLEPRRPGL